MLDEAKLLVDSLRDPLAAGGFELRQWASNIPDIICHLPKEARSESSELWLNQTGENAQEFALGLRWLCHSDTLKYECRLLDCPKPTVLTWLQSDSCRFKVFVGTRVAEIQELTNDQTWRYVDSTNNPADDITRERISNR